MKIQSPTSLTGTGHIAASASGSDRKCSPRRNPLAVALVIVLIAALPLISSQPFYLHMAILIAINTVSATGLSLLSRTGQTSLCHGAFIAIGAYASALLSLRLGMPFPVAALGAMAASTLVALALGVVILRLRGIYFVLITFAFGELVRLALLEWEDVTGGANGIVGILPAAFGHITLDSKLSFYLFAATVALLCIAASHAIFRSPIGHRIDAVGENAPLAEASGLSVSRTQYAAFAVASAIGGLSGSMFAHYIGFVSPETFNFMLSVGMIIILVVGGRGYVLGPFIGALIMTPLPELFRGAVEMQNIFYGCALILMLRFMPRGLASLQAKFQRKHAGHSAIPGESAQ